MMPFEVELLDNLVRCFVCTIEIEVDTILIIGLDHDDLIPFFKKLELSPTPSDESFELLDQDWSFIPYIKVKL